MLFSFTKLSYLSMPFLFEKDQCRPATGIKNMHKYTNFDETGARKVKSGSCDDTWYTEYNDVT